MKTGSVFLKVSNITRLFSKKCAANIRQHKSFEKKPFPIKKKSGQAATTRTEETPQAVCSSKE